MTRKHLAHRGRSSSTLRGSDFCLQLSSLICREMQVSNEAAHSSCYSACDDDCHHGPDSFFCLFCSLWRAVGPTCSAYRNALTDTHSSSPNSYTNTSSFYERLSRLLD